MAASELLRDKLGSLGIDCLAPKIGHGEVEVGAECSGELVLIKRSELDEHPAQHSRALQLDFESSPKLHLADQPLSDQPLPKAWRAHGK